MEFTLVGNEWKDAIDPANNLIVDIVPDSGKTTFKVQYPNGQIQSQKWQLVNDSG